MSTPVSGSSYIIICQARIGIALGDDEGKKIAAVSQGAAQLSAFMQSYYKHFNLADLVNISTLQHALMDHVNGKIPLTPDDVQVKIKAMVHEMYELEKKYV